MTRVFLVEDHPVVRKGYTSFIAREPGLEICGEAGSAREALAQLPAAKPEIVVLDVSLPGDMNGIDLLTELKRIYPTLPVLVVSGNEEAIYGDLVVKMGAWGYVMKGNVTVFMDAIRRIADYARSQNREIKP